MHMNLNTEQYLFNLWLFLFQFSSFLLHGLPESQKENKAKHLELFTVANVQAYMSLFTDSLEVTWQSSYFQEWEKEIPLFACREYNFFSTEQIG